MPHKTEINIMSRVIYITTMPLCNLLVIAEYSVWLCRSTSDGAKFPDICLHNRICNILAITVY